MRSFRARRIVSLLSILLLSLASAGCPELNRQPDYMGNQSVSIDAPSSAIAAAQPGSSARQVFDHANIMVSN
jgi:hypothetical protein